jgi:hypothetical protein
MNGLLLLSLLLFLVLWKPDGDYPQINRMLRNPIVLVVLVLVNVLMIRYNASIAVLLFIFNLTLLNQASSSNYHQFTKNYIAKNLMV